MRRRVVPAVAAIAMVASAIAGCSSSSGKGGSSSSGGSATSASSASGGSSSSGGSSAATGTAIKIMGSTSLSGINSPLPETEGGLKAGIAELNASGGINGHKIDLTICDTQGNQNLAQSCAQKAVADKDVAVLAPANVITSAMIPTLQKAGIPLIGADTNTPLDATSPISFPAVPGGYDLNNAIGAVAKTLSCKKVSSIIIQAPDITGIIASSFKKFVLASGLNYGGPTYSPVSQTNFSSTLAAVTSTGADCVGTALAVAQTTGVLTSWKQSGSKLKMIIPGTTLASLSTISSIDTGIYVYSPVRLATDPLVAPTVAAVKKWASGTTITARSIEAYAIVQLFATALKTAKPASYTAQTVLSAMNGLRNASTGNVLPPYSSVPSSVAGQQRVFSHDFVVYQVSGANTKTVSSFVTIPGIATAVK